jgi:hypothetical protein
VLLNQSVVFTLFLTNSLGRKLAEILNESKGFGRIYRYPAGALSAQGLACSNCPARRNNVASSPNLPTKCIPIGRFSAFQWSGTDMAGWPVTLKTGVQGMNSKVAAARGLIMPIILSRLPPSKLPIRLISVFSLATSWSEPILTGG